MGMKAEPINNIIWLCDQNHLEHPFIPLGAKTLTEAGYLVTVVDRATRRANEIYRHIPLGLPRQGWRIGNRLVRGSGKINRWLGWPLIFLTVMLKKPAIIIADLPSTAGIGWLAKKIFNSKLVYYPFELFGEQSFKVEKFLQKLELKVLQRGIDALITQNSHRALVYTEERGARVSPFIVHNYKKYKVAEKSGKMRSLLQLSKDCRIVLYEGILVNGRCLDKLILAMQYVSEDVKLVFMGRQTEWFNELVNNISNKLPAIAEKIMFVPWIPQEEMLGYVVDADVGIIIYDDKVRNNFFCEPGKLSDFALAGVPVVAPNFPTLAPVIQQYAIGAVFNHAEPAEIARAINGVLAIAPENWQAAMAQAQKALIWETQGPILFKALESLSRVGIRRHLMPMRGSEVRITDVKPMPRHRVLSGG